MKAKPTLMDNPKFREFIQQFRELMAETQTLTLAETRKLSGEFFSPLSHPRESVYKIEDRKIKGQEGNEIPIRIYTSSSLKTLPVLVYYHRGGWVFSNVEEADPVCRKLANHLGCIVASVDYRLAPENPFPKPFNDCYDAFLWVSEHALELGSRPQSVIVCGESVGGNLAAAVALKARDTKGPSIAAQLLICPVITSNIQAKPYAESADQYFITKDSMEFFWKMYLKNPEDATNCYASPDYATDFRHLPPALIVIAEHDPLSVEGESYAMQLKNAGNHVLVEKFSDVVHSFLDLPAYSDEEVISWLKRIKQRLTDLLNHHSHH